MWHVHVMCMGTRALRRGHTPTVTACVCARVRAACAQVTWGRKQVREQLHGITTDRQGSFELTELEGVLRRDVCMQEEGLSFERPVIFDMLPLVAKTFDAHHAVDTLLEQATARDVKIRRDHAQAMRRLKHSSTLKSLTMSPMARLTLRPSFGSSSSRSVLSPGGRPLEAASATAKRSAEPKRSSKAVRREIVGIRRELAELRHLRKEGHYRQPSPPRGEPADHGTSAGATASAEEAGAAGGAARSRSPPPVRPREPLHVTPTTTNTNDPGTGAEPAKRSRLRTGGGLSHSTSTPAISDVASGSKASAQTSGARASVAAGASDATHDDAVSPLSAKASRPLLAHSHTAPQLPPIKTTRRHHAAAAATPASDVKKKKPLASFVLTEPQQRALAAHARRLELGQRAPDWSNSKEALFRAKYAPRQEHLALVSTPGTDTRMHPGGNMSPTDMPTRSGKAALSPARYGEAYFGQLVKSP